MNQKYARIGLSPSGADGYKADALMALTQDVLDDAMKQGKKTLEEKESYFTGRFKQYMDVFAAYLGDNDYFFGSEKMTSADLELGILSIFLKRMLNTRYDQYFAEPYPKLEALAKKALTNENVAKWIASDPKKPFGTPLFEDAAKPEIAT